MVAWANRGWGFKLDYDREIAADSKLIEQLTRLIENRRFHPGVMIKAGFPIDISGYSITLIDLAFLDVMGTAAQLGLSLLDLSDLACVMDREDFAMTQLDGSVVALPEEAQGAYKRGGVLVDRLEKIWSGDLYSEEKSLALLKKAKADLARHKRNKAKYA